jgi:mitochondrial fission protein ELM1
MERPQPSRDIWSLSDGHAGNARQASALAAALATDPADFALSPRAPWRWAAPRTWPLSHIAFGRDFAAALQVPPALAIGCGRQAALATRLLRERGSKVVQILDPRIDPKHWDLVIAPEHDGLHGDNVLTLLGSLHPVDDLWLAQARADFSVLALPQPRTTLLVGGPSRDAGLDDAAFAKQLQQLEAALLRDGGSLLLTTSRRTPDAWRQQVRQRFASIPGVRWFAPADGNNSGDDNPYAGLLAWADRIVCTPDSVNMVSEACATLAPVFVLEPARTRGRLRRFHDSLLARGRVRSFEGSLEAFAVEPLRETARVAAEVRQRLDL